MDPQTDLLPYAGTRKTARLLLTATLLIVPVNCVLYWFALARSPVPSFYFFIALAAAQTLLGLAGFVAALVYAGQLRKHGLPRGTAFLMAFFSVAGAGGGVLGAVGGTAALVALNGSHG